MKREEKMLRYGLTEEDMSADVETLTDYTIRERFRIEFDSDVFVMCPSDGKPGHFDGECFRYRPEGMTDDEEMDLIKESLKAKKNLFKEKWTNIAHFKTGVDY